MQEDHIINNTSALVVIVFESTVNASVFVSVLQRLLKQAAGTTYLIVDGHPLHKSANATRYTASHSTQPRLIRLPAYRQELNPDELLN